ncbi:MAG: tetratricopeptide repeat protein [Acidobacteria bacterium]|nr:tetratricopeptide repeat protein [Acidobacteriota bacterium]
MATNPRIEDLRKRLEKEPGSRLFAQLAEELRKEGELDEAIRLCREGLERHPAYPSARMTLGRALFDTGDVAGARSEFEAVVRTAPDNILAGRLLGECLEGLGDLGGAVARYRATLVFAPGDKNIQARLEGAEARLEAPAETMPEGEGAPEVVQEAAEAEPPPIPLAQVDGESFELESAHEAQPTLVGEAVQPAAETTGEPAPIPILPGTQGFELEAAYEAPVATIPFRPAPDVSAAPAPVARPIEEPPPIASSTLAELYFDQGFHEQAIEVYRQVLEREPSNERARARLKEVEALDRHLRGADAGPTSRPSGPRRQAVERTIARLEGFLAAVRRG